MLRIEGKRVFLAGPKGDLEVSANDEALWKLAMLYEGECEAGGPGRAAAKFGYSKPRYFQLRKLLRERGVLALASEKRGPKRNYRRTAEVVRQIIRYRFLDPAISAAVIAQKLRQTGSPISVSSVERTIAEYGLQKKTSRLST